MNEQQYNNLFRIHGKAFKNYNKWVDPDCLLEFDQKARVKGDLQTNIERYTGQFLNGVAQNIPVSVVPIPGSNGYRVHDGVTRGRAKQLAKPHDATQEVLINTYCHEVLCFTAEQWEDFQDSANDHLGAQASTDNDLKGAVQKRIDSGRMDSIVKGENNGIRLDPTNPKEVTQYSDLGGKWFANEIFPNSGRRWTYFRNEIKRCLKGSVKYVTKIKTHTDKDLQKSYSDLGGTSYGLTSGTFNKISNNERVFVLRSNDRVAPNLYGSFVQHVINNPSADFTILINYDKVLSKEDDDITSDRNEVVSSVAKMFNLISNVSCKVTVKSPDQITSDPAGFQILWDSNRTSGKRLSAVNI
jgi:hypothetical protein